MYSKEQISELIEQYIEQKLPDHKLSEIKHLIETDEEWKREYESQFSAHEFVKELGFLGIQDDLSKDLAEMKDPTQQTSTKYWLTGAGIVAVGTLLFVTVSLDKNKPVSENTESKTIILDTTSNSPQIKITDLKLEISKPIVQKTEKEVESISNVEENIQFKNIDLPTVSDKKTELNTIQNNNTQTLTTANDIQSKTENKTDLNNTSVKKDICADYKPEIELLITPSTFSEENGSFEIKPKQGWENSKVKVNNGSFSDKLVFENLKAGQYTLESKNSNNCISKLTSVTIPNTNCSPNNDDQFSPNTDRVWKTQLDENQICNVQIMNKRKEIVFEKSNIKTDFFEWDGTNSNNEMVTTGLYKVFIQYKNGERCLLSLTVFE